MLLRVVRTGLKYFVYGLLIGLFVAPRRGEETRQIVLDWIGARVDSVFGVVNAQNQPEA